MTATQAQPEAVLDAAKFILGARQDDMLTIDEWFNLARAVATVTGKTTVELLTKRDLDDIAEHWPEMRVEAVDGPLPTIE